MPLAPRSPGRPGRINLDHLFAGFAAIVLLSAVLCGLAAAKYLLAP